jgi:hypothetical protein
VAAAEVMERCADPVMVNMTVSPSYRNMFSVSGDGLGSEVNVSGSVVRVEYGRNASHLHFKVGLSLSLSVDALFSTDLLMAIYVSNKKGTFLIALTHTTYGKMLKIKITYFIFSRLLVPLLSFPRF